MYVECKMHKQEAANIDFELYYFFYHIGKLTYYAIERLLNKTFICWDMPITESMKKLALSNERNKETSCTLSAHSQRFKYYEFEGRMVIINLSYSH